MDEADKCAVKREGEAVARAKYLRCRRVISRVGLYFSCAGKLEEVRARDALSPIYSRDALDASRRAVLGVRLSDYLCSALARVVKGSGYFSGSFSEYKF